MATTMKMGELFTELAFRDLTGRGWASYQASVARAQAGILKASRMSIGMGAALTGVLATVGNTSLKFERSMNALQAATNASSADMGRMREQARFLGETTVFSAVQAAEAQRELGLAGMQTNQILGTMPGVLSLAAAGQLQMAEASSITTSILAAYKLEAGQSGRVSDVLAAAASNAKTTVSDMGQAFVNVGVRAALAGSTIEESAAALATFQQVGIGSLEAGTGLRNVLSRATLLNTMQQEALQGAGIDTAALMAKAAEGDVLGMAQALSTAHKVVNEEGKEVLTAGAQAAFGKAFGQRIVNYALALGDNVDFLENMIGILEGSQGTAQRMADQMMAGLPGAVAEMKSAVEGLKLSLASAGITERLTQWGRGIRDLARWMQSLSPSTQGFIADVLLAGPALIGVGTALRFAAWGLSPFARGLHMVRASLVPAIAEMIRMRKAGYLGIGMMGRMAGEWFRGLSMLARGGIIGGAIAGLILVIAKWDEIRAAARGAFFAVRDFFSSEGGRRREVGRTVDAQRQIVTLLEEQLQAMVDQEAPMADINEMNARITAEKEEQLRLERELARLEGERAAAKAREVDIPNLEAEIADLDRSIEKAREEAETGVRVRVNPRGWTVETDLDTDQQLESEARALRLESERRLARMRLDQAMRTGYGEPQGPTMEQLRGPAPEDAAATDAPETGTGPGAGTGVAAANLAAIEAELERVGKAIAVIRDREEEAGELTGEDRNTLVALERERAGLLVAELEAREAAGGAEEVDYTGMALEAAPKSVVVDNAGVVHAIERQTVSLVSDIRDLGRILRGEVPATYATAEERAEAMRVVLASVEAVEAEGRLTGPVEALAELAGPVEAEASLPGPVEAEASLPGPVEALAGPVEAEGRLTGPVEAEASLAGIGPVEALARLTGPVEAEVAGPVEALAEPVEALARLTGPVEAPPVTPDDLAALVIQPLAPEAAATAAADLAAPPEASLPPAPAPGGPGGAPVNVDLGGIVVNAAPGQDPEEIARLVREEVRAELEEQFGDLVEDAASPIVR